MNIKSCSLLLGLLCYSGVIVAQSDVDVVTTITAGVTNVEYDLFEIVTTTNSALGITFYAGNSKVNIYNSSIQFAEIGVTLLDWPLYYGFTTLIAGQAISDRQLISNTGFNNIFTATPIDKQSSTYSTYNIFAGYAVMDSLSIYGGLTSNTTNIGSAYVFKGQGPFIGMRYAYQLSANSSLTFDFSYLSGETDFATTEDEFGLGYSADLNSQGFSYSLTWLRSLDRGRTFFIRLKLTDMEFDGTGTTSDGFGTGEVRIDGNQSFTRVSFGMGF